MSIRSTKGRRWPAAASSPASRSAAENSVGYRSSRYVGLRYSRMLCPGIQSFDRRSMNAPVPTGLRLNRSPQYSTASRGTTKVWNMARMNRNGVTGFSSTISKR